MTPRNNTRLRIYLQPNLGVDSEPPHSCKAATKKSKTVLNRNDVRCRCA